MGVVSGTVAGFYGGMGAVVATAVATDSEVSYGTAMAAACGGGTLGAVGGAVAQYGHHLIPPPMVQNPK